MIRRLQSLSIKVKLILLAALSVVVALGITMHYVYTHDTQEFRDQKVEELNTLSRMLAFNSSAIVLFEDTEHSHEFLESLSLENSIEHAMLYGSNGHEIGRYDRQEYLKRKESGKEAPHTAEEQFAPEELTILNDVPIVQKEAQPVEQAETVQLPEKEQFQFTPSGHLTVWQPIIYEEEQIGALFLEANMHELTAHVQEFKRLALSVTSISLLISMILAILLQDGISKPVLQLTQAARKVTSNGDYSIRVNRDAEDELGLLSTTFNQMLEKIETTESQLLESHELLEARVIERTARLSLEVKEHQATERQLMVAKENAEAANQAKSEFLANMSHEIRTPMNAILGFADLLRKGSFDDEEEAQEFYETIYSSGRHLLLLIDDILDLSKIEAGQMEVECIPASPHQTISEVVSIMRVPAQEKGLQLDYNWVSDIPSTIQTDPVRLRQLLVNLVGNAIKFTEHGGVQITVDIEDADDEPEMVIEVIDTGIGIPQDKLDLIFNPFAQADTSVTRRFGGTGLGLAICKHIAEALGGTIEVTSRIGSGSVFTVRIQTGSLQGIVWKKSEADIMKPRVPEAKKLHQGLEGLSVLVVEDGETNRKLIRLVLERAGANVTSAENGQLGVEAVMRERFDLVLMDMQMPVLDGYTAAQRMRTQGVSIPIIALTAHAMKGDKEKCLRAGCSGYLTKPIDPKKLVETVSLELSTVQDPDNSSPSDGQKPLQQQGSSVILSTLPLDDVDFREIVEEFIQRTHEKFAEILEAWKEKDLQRLAQLAHWLKGAGGTAGFPMFTAPAKELELMAKDESLDEIPLMITEIEKIVVRLALDASAENLFEQSLLAQRTGES